MSRFIDLSQDFADGMPGFTMRGRDGRTHHCTAHIRPFLTREASAPLYGGKASFEITEMSFQTALGTRLDAPYTRFAEGRDIADLALDEVVLPGIAVDARGRAAGHALSPPEVRLPEGVQGHAVLINFGWDAHYGRPEAESYPFISRDLLRVLIERGVRLVGVDTVNADDYRDAERPAHTWLLERDILIVENLCNLDRLHGKAFRFFAVPIKARETAAMPVRAFAELNA